MNAIYTINELFWIQDKLVEMFPDHEQEIYKLFNNPFGEPKEEISIEGVSDEEEGK